MVVINSPADYRAAGRGVMVTQVTALDLEGVGKYVSYVAVSPHIRHQMS